LTCIKRSRADEIKSSHSKLISQSGGLDGNKRIGILAMIVFLKINGLALACTDNELETLGWGLAEGSINEPELIEWIISHS
jgi:death-on-curing protein